jgi:hypothetical protein
MPAHAGIHLGLSQRNNGFQLSSLLKAESIHGLSPRALE